MITLASMGSVAPMTPAMPANIQVTLALAIILFAIGLVGFLTRRNMILMFLLAMILQESKI